MKQTKKQVFNHFIFHVSVAPVLYYCLCMNKIIHPTHVSTFNYIKSWRLGVSRHFSYLFGIFSSYGQNLLATNAPHVTIKGGGICGQLLQKLGRDWVQFRRETKLLCCTLAKQSNLHTLQERVDRNHLMTFCIFALQQSALGCALPTGFLASVKPSSTSQASARKTSVAALPRRSLDRRTRRRS